MKKEPFIIISREEVEKQEIIEKAKKYLVTKHKCSICGKSFNDYTTHTIKDRICAGCISELVKNNKNEDKQSETPVKNNKKSNTNKKKTSTNNKKKTNTTKKSEDKKLIEDKKTVEDKKPVKNKQFKKSNKQVNNTKQVNNKKQVNDTKQVNNKRKTTKKIKKDA